MWMVRTGCDLLGIVYEWRSDDETTMQVDLCSQRGGVKALVKGVVQEIQVGCFREASLQPSSLTQSLTGEVRWNLIPKFGVGCFRLEWVE